MNAPDGVGMTAILVAAARALESARPDRLFEDPWAGQFVSASGWQPSSETVAAARDGHGIEWVSVRTKFLDDVVLDGLRGDAEQLVLLGAGLDTRAGRLPVEVPVFEVDTEPVHAFKRSVLDQDAARRVEVIADLRENWADALMAKGLRVDKPTVWIIEGVLIYLNEAEVDAVLAEVSRCSAPGSALGTTLTPPGHLEQVRKLRPVDETSTDPVDPGRVAAMWRSDGPADPTSWLADFGWRAEIFAAAERARAYGRELPEREGRPNRWLVSATH